MDLQRVPDRWLTFYMALFLVLFMACIMIAKLVLTHSQIWHDILLVISGLMLAGLFSIAAVKRAKTAIEDDSDNEG